MGQCGVVSGCLGVAEYQSIGARKPAAISSGLPYTTDCGIVGTTLLAGTQKAVAELARLPFLPWEEWHSGMLQESTGFGDSKQGHMLEREILCHRPGEQGMWRETRETKWTVFPKDALRIGS